MRIGAILLTIAVVTSAIGFGIATASPPPQGELIPTPTAYPIDISNFTYEQVGGEEKTLTFNYESDDIFTVGEATVTSEYPRGMVFTLPVSSSAGEVTSVRLNLYYVSGDRFGVRAEYDTDLEAWVAKPWELGDGQPAWTQFTFEWSIIDDQDNQLITELNDGEYWDATREWTRFDFETFIAFLYNYEHIYSTQELGEALATAVSATEPRRAEGFGGQMSYKPVLTYYASDADYEETIGSGISNPTAGGFANSNWGMSLQFFNADAFDSPGPFEVSPNNAWYGCAWVDPEFNPEIAIQEGTAAQRSIDFAIYQTTPHELTHLYQSDFEVSNTPSWWTEGQAEYFSYSTHNVVLADVRLQYLASLNDQIPDIAEGVSRNIEMDDGCIYLTYHVGQSFVTWFAYTYGIDAHAELMHLMGEESQSLFDGLETVTGKPFLDLQNEWRQYIGFATLSLADVDPASALEEAVDPLYATGDTFVLEGAFQTPILADPGTSIDAVGACFSGTEVTVMRVGKLDGVNYYEVDCLGLIGWFPEEVVQ